jgi:hypothetical protein
VPNVNICRENSRKDHGSLRGQCLTPRFATANQSRKRA